jgi:cell division protein FtsQ
VRAAGATLGRLPRAVTVLPRTVAALPRALAIGPHGRRRLLALAVLAAALAAGYLFWLRDSSLVRVEHVTVTGVDTADAPRVRAKLTAAAREMTTLHVNAEALRRAVADEPVVHSLAVHPDFPHGLKIEVVQNRPVALLVGSGREMVVAPDGTLLDGTNVAADLPIVRVASLPSSGRIPAGPARDRVAVAAAAPPRLLSQVESVSIEHGRGAVAQLRHGPVVIFGRPVELERKWAAATAVLAQRSSQGATYIDVRMPDRPVAGGLPLQQDPQAQAQVPPSVPAPGSPGVVPAAPAAVPGAPTQAQQTQPQPPVTPATGTAASPVTGATTPSTQAQP